MEKQKVQNLLKLALVQFDPSWEDAAANRSFLQKMLAPLEADTDVIILPEAFSTGFTMKAAELAETMDGPTLNWMKTLAVHKQMLVCGSLFIEEAGKYYNRFVWIEPDGKLETYDKRHLFSIGGEDLNYTAGNSSTLIEYKGWRIFPQICYDLRFPVWSRNTQSYDLLINVASWPAPRNKVWETLLMARAIENQCYVAAVNRLGQDGNGITHLGNSMVIDAKGEVCTAAINGVGISYSSIDLNSLHQFRTKFNTLNDQDRFELQP